MLMFFVGMSNGPEELLPVITGVSMLALAVRRRFALKAGGAAGLTPGEMAAERTAELEERVAELEAARPRWRSSPSGSILRSGCWPGAPGIRSGSDPGHSGTPVDLGHRHLRADRPYGGHRYPARLGERDQQRHRCRGVLVDDRHWLSGRSRSVGAWGSVGDSPSGSRLERWRPSGLPSSSNGSTSSSRSGAGPRAGRATRFC